jgi:dephospho-CoA kinase
MATKGSAPSRARPRIIGVTGSIGSGKSAVAERFARLGARIIDADMLAREAVAAGTSTLEAVIRRFGKEMLTAEGELDRKRLGALVFSDPSARLDLEAIVHPRVRELFTQALAEAEKTPSALIVYVVPLLFETRNRYPELERSILVASPKESCLRRVMARDGVTREFAEMKYAAQMPESEKRKRADIVIENNAGEAELDAKVRSVFDALTGDAPPKAH